jgi:hypothetical protein
MIICRASTNITPVLDPECHWVILKPPTIRHPKRNKKRYFGTSVPQCYWCARPWMSHSHSRTPNQTTGGPNVFVAQACARASLALVHEFQRRKNDFLTVVPGLPWFFPCVPFAEGRTNCDPRAGPTGLDLKAIYAKISIPKHRWPNLGWQSHNNSKS